MDNVSRSVCEQSVGPLYKRASCTRFAVDGPFYVVLGNIQAFSDKELKNTSISSVGCMVLP